VLCLHCDLLSAGMCECGGVRGPVSKAVVLCRCYADLGCSRLLLAEGEGVTQGGNQQQGCRVCRPGAGVGLQVLAEAGFVFVFLGSDAQGGFG